MKAGEIRDLSGKERQEKASDLREELFNLKLHVATGKIENPGRIKLLRRDIARIKTIQREQSVQKKDQETPSTQAGSEKT